MLGAGGACMAMSAPLADAPLRPPTSGSPGFQPVLVAHERIPAAAVEAALEHRATAAAAG